MPIRLPYILCSKSHTEILVALAKDLNEFLAGFSSPTFRSSTKNRHNSLKALRPQCRDWYQLRKRLLLKEEANQRVQGEVETTRLPFLMNEIASEHVVETILESTEGTEILAQQIFSSYAIQINESNGAIGLAITSESIAHLFTDAQEAEDAFAVLDQNKDGVCTYDEIRAVCQEFHQERMCLLASMHDVDSAVAKLDHILVTIWFTASCVIIVALLSTKFSTLIASLGAILLGLSWLVSSTAQESLSSVLWVFCKHPIDVGDVILVPGLLSMQSASTTHDQIASLQGYNDGDTFVVEEIELLSTKLRTIFTGKHVSVSNYILSQKVVVNYRRSGPLVEVTHLKVSYETPMDSIESLRQSMRNWLVTQNCDFDPDIHVTVDELDDQSHLGLTLGIRYKSNWQDPELRLKRRNRWMTALKHILKVHGIVGPGQLTNAHKHTTEEAVPVYDFMGSIDTMGKYETKCWHNKTPLYAKRGRSSGNHEKFSRLNVALNPRQSLDEITEPDVNFRQHANTSIYVDSAHASGQPV